MTGRAVAGEDVVRDAGAGERRHLEPVANVELRGRHRPTHTWLLRAG